MGVGKPEALLGNWPLAGTGQAIPAKVAEDRNLPIGLGILGALLAV